MDTVVLDDRDSHPNDLGRSRTSSFLLSTAREVVNDVIRDDVPRVINTARLSATTADLGLLSNRLLRANEADLAAVEIGRAHV